MIKILRQFPEVWALPLALFACWWLPELIAILDPTAGVFDASVFQLPVIAAVCQLFANAFIFAGLKFNFPNLYKWYINDTRSSFWRFAFILFVYKVEFVLILLAIA